MYLLLQKFEIKDQYSLKTWLFIFWLKYFKSKNYLGQKSLLSMYFLSFSLFFFPHPISIIFSWSCPIVEHEQVAHLWLVSKLKNHAICGFLIKAKMGTKESESILFSISTCIIFLSQQFFFQFQQAEFFPE